MPSKNSRYGKRKPAGARIANTRKRPALENEAPTSKRHSPRYRGDLSHPAEDYSTPEVNEHNPRPADVEALIREPEVPGSALSSSSSSVMSATGSCDEDIAIGGSATTSVKNGSVSAGIQGRRIVSLQYLLSSLQKTALHAPFNCTLADMDSTSIEDLQRATSKQSGSTVWKQERRKRLTASLFGATCKMKPTTGCGRTVGDILYKEITSEAIRYGKDHERLALKRIENECNVVVKERGLFVDQESPFLGASPDGLIGEDVLVEVKCPYSARDLTPLEGVRAKKITGCEENKNRRLQL
ncbi:hypothetical protein V5799_008192 [Amblyomma americanum]|uniref:YqaJ viral recombinase domain-containing protein n=1 Tax=Amblyomma americanum TaxID=6943 RepID=A0AAQ4FF57_AMBAM